jgi:hypothetical protein
MLQGPERFIITVLGPGSDAIQFGVRWLID